MWKLCAVVVNRRLKRGVDINDMLYGLRKGRVTWMSTQEDKLAKYLARISHKSLFRCSWISARLMTHLIEGYDLR